MARLEVPVVFACDDAYAMPFGVALDSLLRHADPANLYKIYCLVPAPLDPAHAARLQETVARHGNAELALVDMRGAFAEVAMRIRHISFVTYYRLKIASLLPQHDRCVYLDVDLVVQADIAALLQADMALADGYEALLAGVAHAAYRQRTAIGGAPIAAGSYVNAGVLVMNLKAIRREGKEAEFTHWMDKQLPDQDQDVLNVACAGRIKPLAPEWNFMPKLVAPGRKRAARRFYARTGFDLDEAARTPRIIHYADRYKPWAFHHLPYGGAWDAAYAHSAFAGGELARRDYRLQAVTDFCRKALRFAARRLRGAKA